VQRAQTHGWAVMCVGSSALLIKSLLFGYGCGVVEISCGWRCQREHEPGGVLYDLAVNRRVCGSVAADGKMYAAGAARRRTSLCCPMGVVCFIFSAGPGTASYTDQRSKGRVFTLMSALTVARAGTRLGSHVCREFRPPHQVNAVWVWLWCV
jgi:hypothetical protein